MHRRDFIAAMLATTLIPRASFGAGAAQTRLIAQPVQQVLLPPGNGPTQLLGFNGSVPGPEVRVGQGERLSVAFENRLQQGSAVHWHGIRLPNPMDGVPGLTQDPVAPGEAFDYGFVAPDAGTYWYHSHHLSHEQVARGMMGPLIVEDSTPPDVDHDIVALLADWRLDEDGTLLDDFGNMHDMAHGGRMGNYAKAFLSQARVATGQRIRLRIINGATDRIFPLVLGGLDGRVVALDGMPLPAPRAMADIVLAPAQRVDIIADVTGPVSLDMATRQGDYRLGDLDLSGDVTPRGTTIAALAPKRVATPSTPAQRLTLTMSGGAMGGRHGGDDIWSFNDLSGMQPEPFASFSQGETARISLVNDTRFPHGIHLHGHHFHELTPEGDPGDLRDTSLVAVGETRDILCVFDNPGRWMLHCHMLSHQAAGMKTWVEVT